MAMAYHSCVHPIYHITSKSEWNEAEHKGIYDRSTRGKSFDEVGFIHASTLDQLPDTANFVFAGTDVELVVIELDIGTLELSGIQVVFEDGGDGQIYPHIYSTIPTDLIVGVHAVEFDGSNFRIV